MTENRIIKGSRELSVLAEQLSRCPGVARCDGAKEIWELVHCFESLERLFLQFVEVDLPRLMNRDLAGEQVCELLYEIGANLQQVVYHIKQPEFYSYLGETIGSKPTGAG